MKLTNECSAPASIVAAIEADPYSKDGADFSITELFKPPQIRRLWLKHEKDISVDVRDEMFKLMGTAVHQILGSAPKCKPCYGTGECWSGDWERPTTIWDKLKAWTRGDRCVPCDSCDGTGLKDDGKIREERFHASHNGTTISGAVDLIDDGEITDYKVTSVFSVQCGLKTDWESQLNLYAWLLRQNDITTTSLNIVTICRDWTRSRVGKPDYPDSPVVVLTVPVWSDERQDRYLDGRIRIHRQEATIPCTPEERWARGAYEVTGGRGRPQTFDALNEATRYVNEKNNPKLRVVKGNAKFIRCESWCDVAQFCPQWNSEKRAHLQRITVLDMPR